MCSAGRAAWWSCPDCASGALHPHRRLKWSPGFHARLLGFVATVGLHVAGLRGEAASICDGGFAVRRGSRGRIASGRRSR